MSLPGSARPAVTAAVIAALTGDATLTAALGGAKVWVNVPDKTPAPYLWVLGGEEVPIERTFGRNDRRAVAVEVTAVSAYRGTAEIDSLLSRVIEVLVASPAVTGYTARWVFATNRRPERAEEPDGTLVWLGTVVFEVQLV